MSGNERKGLAIALFAAIIIFGFLIFILPCVNRLNDDRAALFDAENELTLAGEKIMNADALKKRITEAYRQGIPYSDIFFDDLTSYKADGEFREFVKRCADNNINVTIDNVSVSGVYLYELAPKILGEEQESYPIKNYAESDNGLSEGFSGESQSVEAVTVYFDVYADDAETLLKFIKAADGFEMEENGRTIKKAMILNGYSITFNKSLEKYGIPSGEEYCGMSTSVTFFGTAKISDPSDELGE